MQSLVMVFGRKSSLHKSNFLNLHLLMPPSPHKLVAPNGLDDDLASPVPFTLLLHLVEGVLLLQVSVPNMLMLDVCPSSKDSSCPLVCGNVQIVPL